MKHRIWPNYLMGAVFAFLLSVSAVGNFVTGFDLTVDSLAVLFLWCACFAFVSSVLFFFRYGETVLLCLIALAIPILWKDGTLWEQLQSLSYIISSHYHDIYAWPVIGSPVTDEFTLPLMVLSAWSSVSVSWTVCRRKHISSVFPPVILPLVLCLITTDHVPDGIYLYLMLLGLALLLLTDWTRRKESNQGIKLTLRMAIPVAAALALLFVTNPREEYVNHAGKLEKEVVSWFQQFQDTANSIFSGVSFESASSQKLSLRYVGPKSKRRHSVMRVNSPINGTLYLRGRDYDTYSGIGWEASLGRTETFTSGAVSAGKLTITTYGVRNVLYTPYYSTEEICLTNGALDNDGNLQTYSYDLSRTHFGRSQTPDLDYTSLPSDTLQWAAPLVNEITSGLRTRSEKVLRIQSYVRNTATYDLSTPHMRSQCRDFAQWFLEESDTGYCVHFATAATVLLRAAGIPARYVEGYMITCKAGEDVVVSNQDAHAWAEYYDASSGAWCILEATPADLQDADASEASTSTQEDETVPDDSATETNASEDAATIPPASQETQPIAPDVLPDHRTEHETGKGSFHLPDWMKVFFRILLAVALVPLQGYIRIAWKRKRWNRGRPNEKALVRWRQARQMARLIKIPFPEELDSLAQKAKFSQHRIQPKELQQFENYRRALLQAVRSKPWYQRILFRWVLAIG